MSDETDDPKTDEALLAERIADALAASGELVPTTEAEVERAEAAGAEHAGPLPESLREYRPPAERDEPMADSTERPRAEVVPLDTARRGRRPGRAWVTHLAAAALGAAAAAALLLSRPPRVEPGTGAASSEPIVTPAEAGPIEERVRVPAARECAKDCCAGASCPAAAAELRQCSSDRTCIACGIAALAENRYRVRLGAFAPTTAGTKLIASTKGAGLQMCVRVGSSETVCTPAHADAQAQGLWALLPLVASAQDLLAGLELTVRPKGSAKAAGSWQSPVTLNPTVLCKGLALQPKSPSGETLGVVSAFLDDTHYVELGRAATVPELGALGARFAWSDVPGKIFETSRAGAGRFALVLGPLDKPAAERLRWALLEQGREARVATGEDHLGAPQGL